MGGGGGVVGVLGPAESPPPPGATRYPGCPSGGHRDWGPEILELIPRPHSAESPRLPSSLSTGPTAGVGPKSFAIFWTLQGMHMQQCSGVLLFGPKPVDFQSFIIHQPEGLLSVLAKPCFVTLKLHGGGGGQGCIRREGGSEVAPEAVRQAVGGGCRSCWGRLLSVTNAIEAATWRQGDSGWA